MLTQDFRRAPDSENHKSKIHICSELFGIVVSIALGALITRKEIKLLSSLYDACRWWRTEWHYISSHIRTEQTFHLDVESRDGRNIFLLPPPTTELNINLFKPEQQGSRALDTINRNQKAIKSFALISGPSKHDSVSASRALFRWYKFHLTPRARASASTSFN